MFMSPEHINEEKTVDGRTDLFSLGVTMYYCLSRRYPFVQPDLIRDEKHLAFKLIAVYHTKEAKPLKLGIEDVQPSAEEALTAIIMKSLKKLPRERYNTAYEMKKQIERMQSMCSTELKNSLELY